MSNRNNMPGEEPRRQTKTNNSKVPRFVEERSNVSTMVGQTAIIDCVVRSDSGTSHQCDIVCEWFFEGRCITEHDDRFRSLYERDGVVGLEITNISVEDEGEYKCVASNTYGKAETKCELLVNVEGKVVEAPRDSTYRENETAVFKCKYDGNPRPEVKWFLGKKEIKNGSKYNIVNKHHLASLEIYDLTCEDGGGYSIVVSNDSGEDEVNFRLTIATSRNGKPEKEDIFSMSSKINSGGRYYKHGSRVTPSHSQTPSLRSLLMGKCNTRKGDPSLEYDFSNILHRGTFSAVKECTAKVSCELYCAKIIPFDDTNQQILESILNEYELLSSKSLRHKCLPRLHEIWVLKSFVVMIIERYDNLSLLDHFSTRSRYCEEDVSDVVRQLCHGLSHLHAHNIIHLNIQPSNIRYSTSSGNVKIVEFANAQEVRKKTCFQRSPSGNDCVEFCAPEILEKESVSRGTDMWSVAVISYILCTGLSPFFCEGNKEKTVKAIQKVMWTFQEESFAGITNESKHFIKRIFLRIPEMRLSAEEACYHPWFRVEQRGIRLASNISVRDLLKRTCQRLNSQEGKCLVEVPDEFKTFDDDDDSSSLSSADDV